MLKIMLKEPISSGFMQDGQLVTRMANYLNVQGQITAKLFETLNVSEKGGWVSFIEPGGNPVLVPLDNIAYIQEQLDESGRKISPVS